jgi:hypothetical protein
MRGRHTSQSHQWLNGPLQSLRVQQDRPCAEPVLKMKREFRGMPEGLGDEIAAIDIRRCISVIVLALQLDASPSVCYKNGHTYSNKLELYYI